MEESNTRMTSLVPAEKLRRTCELRFFSFDSTEDLTPLEEGIIGQERAVRALDFGLTARFPGYNIFMAGPVGTGKTTYAVIKVNKVAQGQKTPSDWVYVYNFSRPDQPRALELPAGQGMKFRQQMAELISEVRSEIKRAFESEQFEQHKNGVMRHFQDLIANLWLEVDQQVKKKGFGLQRLPTGIVPIPLNPEGKPLSEEEFGLLTLEEREGLTRRIQEVQELLGEVLRKVHNLEKEARDRLQELERETALYAMRQPVDRTREENVGWPGVIDYLEEVEKDILQNLEEFRSDGGGEEGQSPFDGKAAQEKVLNRYMVNLLVDHSGTRGAPVVVETNPTYYNLFGKVEYRGSFGTMVTDFTMIKGGAFHRANGGYLILQARDLLSQPFTWEALKRTLKSGRLRIENLAEQAGAIATSTLRPEPIPLNVKIILIGPPLIYQVLYLQDEDFRKFFKVKVDFDTEMPRTEENLRNYAEFIATVCRRDGLKPFDPSAVARIIEHSSRLAQHQEKLSTRFNEVMELLYEAALAAEVDGEQLVTAKHVLSALEEKAYRSNRVQEKIIEMITEGTLLVDTSGRKVGQVNGLAVLELGDYGFGKPSRITAQTYMGKKGVLNIEREIQMSGRIHSKGVFILSGYLAGKFAQRFPLSLSASLTFEQLYEEVEGDSASSAELYALLSSLSGLPIDQGIAVTGSVNQKGEVQPIGGVNEKIEGFFQVCKAKGLTGRQGVLIPTQNVINLMLRDEVVQAVREGRFHIWAVSTIAEGIEVLTGVPAGESDRPGNCPEGTVNFLVERRLRELAQEYRRYEGEKD
ncbi:MAG: AAA family ATPase [Firmicutes bacterium]|nr:AAA family ATPase [Bacillota bacterium]MCL5039311.1 AAA family ATPase [Bacillota bacterium]